MLKEIFARIWAAWGLILFITTMLLFFPFFLLCFLFEEPRRSRISYHIFRNWMNIYLPLIGVRVKIKGLHHFQKNKNYVVICNHSSFMDIPVSSTKLPGPNKTIAKIEMSRIPVFGTLYRLGSVMVDRKSKESRAQSFMQMKSVLQKGMHMIIYPEGTRNKTSMPLTAFHNGAFNLASDTRHEIIPATLKGASNVLPSSKFLYLLPGKIELIILPPVIPGEDAEMLKQKCFELMEKEIQKK